MSVIETSIIYFKPGTYRCTEIISVIKTVHVPIYSLSIHTHVSENNLSGKSKIASKEQ